MEIPVFFNSDAIINGDLIFSSDIHLDCEIIGNVESEKKIIIGPEGFLKGTLRAKELVVFGRFEGDIIVSGPTTLHCGSSISGTLSTQVIEIIDCAFLNVRVNIVDVMEPLDKVKYAAKEIQDVIFDAQFITNDLNTGISDVGWTNPEPDKADNPPLVIAENNLGANKIRGNFLVTHFSETDLTFNSDKAIRSSDARQ